jgi:hypothetical protein
MNDMWRHPDVVNDAIRYHKKNANCPWLTNIVKGCTKIVSFYSNVKNSSAAIPGSVTPKDFDLSSGTISALTGTWI